MTQLIPLRCQNNVMVTKTAANQEDRKIETPQINLREAPKIRQNIRTKNKPQKLNNDIQVPITDLDPCGWRSVEGAFGTFWFYVKFRGLFPSPRFCKKSGLNSIYSANLD